MNTAATGASTKTQTLTVGPDASVFVSDVLPQGDAVVFAMDAESYAASPFLDRRIRRPDPNTTATLPWEQLLGFGTLCGTQQTRWIFHISHVGSTLLSRALGVHPAVLSLREPVLLRWLAHQRAALHLAESRVDLPTWERSLAAALGLVGRPLGEQREVVVKATSYCNVMAREIMGLQPAARAVGVYCDLDNFLAGILKGKGGFLDILEMAPVRLRRLHRLLGRESWSLAAMSPAEQAAMTWTCELLSLWDAQRWHPQRFSWLNFDTWTGREAETMATLAEALAIEWSDEQDERLANSGILTSYSKNAERAFTAQDRLAEIAAVKEREAAALQSGIAWFEQCCQQHPVVAEAIASITGSVK